MDLLKSIGWTALIVAGLGVIVLAFAAAVIAAPALVFGVLVCAWLVSIVHAVRTGR